MDNDWRNIPGYDGMYQINRDGDVRTWRWRGEKRMKNPRLMSQYVRHAGKQSKARFVKLTDAQGKAQERKVLHLMVEVWFGDVPRGKVPYHKNGDIADHCLNNIGFTTRRELGKNTGGKSRRMAVVKINTRGEAVEFYPSARLAAKANHMSYQTVLDRCHGKIKNPYALDGHTYAFDI